MSSSPWYIVSTTIRASGSWCRMTRIASTPPIVPSCRSISVTSGDRRRNSSTASSPDAARPTTSMSGWRPMIRASAFAHDAVIVDAEHADPGGIGCHVVLTA